MQEEYTPPGNKAKKAIAINRDMNYNLKWKSQKEREHYADRRN